MMKGREEISGSFRTEEGYDGPNRLTKIIDPTGKVTEYTYDDLGNRTSTTITVNGVKSTTSYTYDASTNELTKITNPEGSTISYTYDVNGNTLSKTDGTGVIKYEYNSNNQLTKVTKPNGDVIQYAYDGDNKRISKTVNGVVTKYVYDGDQVSEETDALGNVLALYNYDDKGTPVSVTKGGNVYHYQYNGHGDVVALTDSTGNVVATYSYDVWGNITEKTGSIDSLFGYVGQFGYVYDKETGFYFLQSRYYDPGIGRFTTKDRFAGFEDRPTSQNQYTYGENNPVMFVDPSGHFVQIVTGALAGAAIAVLGYLVGLIAQYGFNKAMSHINARTLFTNAISGAISGAIGFGLVSQIAKSFGLNYLSTALLSLNFAPLAYVASRLPRSYSRSSFAESQLTSVFSKGQSAIWAAVKPIITYIKQVY